jgi:hypothetical protein
MGLSLQVLRHLVVLPLVFLTWLVRSGHRSRTRWLATDSSEAIPMRFNGRFLVRNSLITVR